MLAHRMQTKGTLRKLPLASTSVLSTPQAYLPLHLRKSSATALDRLRVGQIQHNLETAARTPLLNQDLALPASQLALVRVEPEPLMATLHPCSPITGVPTRAELSVSLQRMACQAPVEPTVHSWSPLVPWLACLPWAIKVRKR